MKFFFVLLFSVFITTLSSCGKGSSFENEVRNLAELRCKEMQLLVKEATDVSVQIDMRAIQQQIKDKLQSIKEKFKDYDAEMSKRGDAIMEEVMKKCK